MVMKKVLIIEGAKDESNGILRQGFNRLLSRKLKGSMPRIIMGEGKSQTIRKFKNYRPGKPFLLIDLDKPESQKNKDIEKNELIRDSKFVFFMVQEMEAWFLSQPEVLDSFYNEKIRNIPDRPAKDIPNPSDLLYRITKNTPKGKYHKVAHAVELLQRLDADKLINEFVDFKNLIETLKN